MKNRVAHLERGMTMLEMMLAVLLLQFWVCFCQ